MKAFKYIKKAKGVYVGLLNPWVFLYSDGEGKYATWSSTSYTIARESYQRYDDLALRNYLLDIRGASSAELRNVGLI